MLDRGDHSIMNQRPQQIGLIGRPEQGSPGKGKVSCLVIVGKVAKARHPDIPSNENPDCVVHLFGLKVVIQQEQDLQA